MAAEHLKQPGTMFVGFSGNTGYNEHRDAICHKNQPSSNKVRVLMLATGSKRSFIDSVGGQRTVWQLQLAVSTCVPSVVIASSTK